MVNLVVCIKLQRKYYYFSIIQCNEVANSNAMEKERLIRSCNHIKSSGLKIETLISDRHLQIQKWIRENLPEVTHYYDVWHVAKGKQRPIR